MKLTPLSGQCAVMKDNQFISLTIEMLPIVLHLVTCTAWALNMEKATACIFRRQIFLSVTNGIIKGTQHKVT